MTLRFARIQPLQGVAIEEGPVWHSDKRSKHDSTGVCKHHRPKGADGVSDAESSDRRHDEHDLHQNLRALLPLPVHLITIRKRFPVRSDQREEDATSKKNTDPKLFRFKRSVSEGKCKKRLILQTKSWI
ncbi:hypothetical protein GW17_00048143 [Ensete ventricosum]|nr:hypothetical protein GW17_00048143 [Ensete ventricosum]